MAQHDMDIANGTGAIVRGDINDALEALVTQSSGASAPATTFAGQRWYDTTNGVMKRRNAANSAWIVDGPASSTMVQAKAANYTVALSDFGTLIDCSGTFTLSLTAAATLGDGFEFEVRNSGTGIVTIDPDASETIDGATTIAVGQGEAFLVKCNGSAFKTVGRRPAVRGALVSKSGAQSIPSAAATALTWDTENRDTDAIHDGASNTERLTVPSGVTAVRLRANVQFAANATGTRTVGILKNGGDAVGLPDVTIPATTGGAVTSLSINSAIIDVTTGDYFTVSVTQNSGGNLNVEAVEGTWFEMEIVR